LRATVQNGVSGLVKQLQIFCCLNGEIEKLPLVFLNKEGGVLTLQKSMKAKWWIRLYDFFFTKRHFPLSKFNLFVGL
jgi:hypothetical protein